MGNFNKMKLNNRYKIYHGVKGERIAVKEPTRLKRTKLHAQSYEDQKRNDLLFAAIFFMTIGIGCLIILIIQ